MASGHAINIADLRCLAMRRLPRMVFDYIEGGCDDELGIARNEAAFGKYRLTPRYLIDVAQRDLSAKLAGQSYSMPYGVSPTGNAGMFRHDADRLLAAQAAVANVPFVLSNASNASIEDVMKVAPDHTWFQLYGTQSEAVTQDTIRRARDRGVKVLVVSVDVPVSSNRERNRRSGFGHPLKVRPSMMLQAMTHPAWTLEYFGHGGLPHMGNFRPYAGANASPARVADWFVAHFPAPGLTWAYLEQVRALWPRKLFVKGIMHPDDALRCVGVGADGLIVSNHGGRQLDCAPSSLDVLPAVRAAVGGRAEIILDGGVRRGSDIAIARCLGADFVMAGRPTLYGVAAGGGAGVKTALEIFRRELDLTLAQIGCPRAAELEARFVSRENAS